MAGKTALILGATGRTGQKVLHELLQSPEFTKVGEFGRRLTDVSSITGKEKLIQRTIDFENLGQSGLKDEKWDVVFIALGTTRKAAGSAQAFEKIDREYVVNAAREAKFSTPGQRLVYVSSIGANSSSPFLYTRSKGLTEHELAALGYDDTIVFRPAFLLGPQRSQDNILASIVSPLVGFMSHFSNSASIEIPTLARSIVAAGNLGSSKLPASALARKEGKEGAQFTLIENAGALNIAAEA